MYRNLRRGGVGADLEPFLFDFQESREFFGAAAALLEGEGGNEPALGEFGVHFEIELRIVIGGLGAGDGSLVIKALGGELNAQITQFGFGRFELPFGIEHALLNIGVGQFHQNRVGLDRGAGQDKDPFHAAGVERRDPENLFRNQRAIATDLAEHVASLHCIRPDLGLLYGRRGRLEAREDQGDGSKYAQAKHGLKQAFASALASSIWSWNIHVTSGGEARPVPGLPAGASASASGLSRAVCKEGRRPIARYWDLDVPVVGLHRKNQPARSSLIDETGWIEHSRPTMQELRKLFAVAVLVGTGWTVTAESGSERLITLEECIRIAMVENLNVRIVQYEPQISRFGLTGAHGVYDPEFFAGGSRGGSTQPPRFVPETGTIPGSTTDSDSFFAGLRGLMPFGLNYNLRGEVSESTGLTFAQVGGSVIPIPVDQTQGRMVMSLSQPLLRNFWIDGARLTIEFNRTQVGLSELQYELQLMNTVTEVEMAYYDLILAIENVKVQETALQLAQRLLDENRKRVEVGALAPLDEKQAEAQVATSRSDLLSARRMLAVQQNLLKNLISSEYAEWHGVTLVPREGLTALPKVFNLSDSWLQALTQRPELLQSRLNLEQQGIAIRYRRNQLLPQLDLVGSYGRLGTVEGDGYYGRVLTDIREDRGSFYSVGGQIVFPLGNRTARGNYRAAQAEREQALLRLKQIEQSIMVQIDNGIDLARTQFERVDATRQARAYQEAALQAEEKKLESGKSTSFFVLQLQRDLTAARSAEVQALADYNKALVQLALAEGSVLDRNAIVVQRP